MKGSGGYGGQEVSGVARIEGPIVVVDGITGIGYDEMADIIDVQGRVRRGRVLEVGEQFAVVEVFAGTTGLAVGDTRERFAGQPKALQRGGAGGVDHIRRAIQPKSARYERRRQVGIAADFPQRLEGPHFPSNRVLGACDDRLAYRGRQSFKARGLVDPRQNVV